ncbi:hypothetical protein C8R43DRAFT_1132097 [Mycena crocata]|nr:hypothetical protein C8R43DRAFT_1132097 [Mycena crocata]
MSLTSKPGGNFCLPCAQRLGSSPSSFSTCDICGKLCGVYWQLGVEERTPASHERMRVVNLPKPYVYTRYSDSNRTKMIAPPLRTPGSISPLLQVYPQAPVQHPRKRKRTEVSPEPAAHIRSIPHIVLPPGTANAPLPILYQTLKQLLADVNKLLNTPHEEQAFHFKGECAVVADPAVDNANRVAAVAWEMIQKTVLSFNIHTLKIQINAHAALAMTLSSAIWMDCLPDSLETNAPPCRRCEHLLTIGVESCMSGSGNPVSSPLNSTFPTSRPKARVQIKGQRIVVALKHFQT